MKVNQGEHMLYGGSCYTTFNEKLLFFISML